MTQLGRRAFLGALGAASVLSGFTNDAAASAGSGRPLRFIGIYTPHGRAHELWQPGPEFDITYPDSILSPFDDVRVHGASFKKQLLVLDGVDLSAGIEVGTTGHDGPRVILTGSGGNGKNSSIDQYLALERGLGADTPHSTVVLAIGHDQPEIGSSISYGPGGTAVPKWVDPAQTFTELSVPR